MLFVTSKGTTFMKKIIPISFLLFLSLFILYRFTFVSASESQNNFELIADEEFDEVLSTISDEFTPKSFSTLIDEESIEAYEKIHTSITPNLLPQALTISSSMDQPTTIPVNSHSFYLYAPEFVTQNTPVIIACHGYCKDQEEMAGYGKGNFALYTQVYNGYHPNAVILYPTKNYNGEWIAEEIVKLTQDFIQYYQFQGSVFYYGFSQGCLNGPDIIQLYGNFTAAVFVDEDFIAYPYPEKNCPPRGLERSLTQLSSLKALRISGCNYVDTYNDRFALSQLLTKAGITYSEEIYPPETYDHLEVSAVTTRSNIEWLLDL